MNEEACEWDLVRRFALLSIKHSTNWENRKHRKNKNRFRSNVLYSEFTQLLVLFRWLQGWNYKQIATASQEYAVGMQFAMSCSGIPSSDYHFLDEYSTDEIAEIFDQEFTNKVMDLGTQLQNPRFKRIRKLSPKAFRTESGVAFCSYQPVDEEVVSNIINEFCWKFFWQQAHYQMLMHILRTDSGRKETEIVDKEYHTYMENFDLNDPAWVNGSFFENPMSSVIYRSDYLLNTMLRIRHFYHRMSGNFDSDNYASSSGTNPKLLPPDELGLWLHRYKHFGAINIDQMMPHLIYFDLWNAFHRIQVGSKPDLSFAEKRGYPRESYVQEAGEHSAIFASMAFERIWLFLDLQQPMEKYGPEDRLNLHRCENMTDLRDYWLELKVQLAGSIWGDLHLRLQ